MAFDTHSLTRSETRTMWLLFAVLAAAIVAYASYISYSRTNYNPTEEQIVVENTKSESDASAGIRAMTAPAPNVPQNTAE